ncbi:uncharacterized protein K452DRAFT_346079 [Aplosporella prunicola CBS 121167]|uniref:Uncharacterized protein n=1 Tax=Aplosporella prunicola CBS 121167 TaxID=1176127 RepID=A0A6A6BHR8_9PEZI|nr:uncharacterized protein K452DRAFT_346079 [Aplosporella prunicola CBS 121167]KAF2143536.1 hypothetical protein K452DRAFT_346079 [Aplosporella prunicola CBS 121167]
MTSSTPIISLRLQQDPHPIHSIWQLRRPTFLSQNVLKLKAIETEQTVSFFCDGLHEKQIRVSAQIPSIKKLELDIAVALQSGLLQFVEDVTQEVVQFPSTKEPPGRIEVELRPSPNPYQACVSLTADTTAQIWKDTLQAGKTYCLRFSPDRGESYCLHKNSGQQKLHARREPDVMRFAVYDDPPPPTFSAVLSVDPDTCHRSGTPPFKFVVDITSPCDEHITVKTESTPFGAMQWCGGLNSIDQLITFTDLETGEEVEFDWCFGCSDDRATTEFVEEDFVELLPGEPWRFEYEFTQHNNLLSGRRYKVELAKASFHSWMFGRKEELLTGSEQEKKARWRPGPGGRGNIQIKQQNEPVMFNVVDQGAF